MKRVLPVIALLLAAQGAHADTVLHSPKLWKASTERFVCIATNVGKKTLDPPFSFAFLGEGGSFLSLAGTGSRSVPLDPGEAFTAISSDTAQVGGCRFSGKFSPKSLRLTHCRASTTNVCLDSVTTP